MKTRKLSRMPYAHAQVREYRKADGDKSNMDVLQSYATDVLIINYDSNLIGCTGLYSKTTRKHISSFMAEKGLRYSIAKSCALDMLMYNFVTGEYTSIL